MKLFGTIPEGGKRAQIIRKKLFNRWTPKFKGKKKKKHLKGPKKCQNKIKCSERT